MPLVLGIDEAGRGAVLGPLIVAGVVFPEKDLPRLTTLNIKESKSVTRAQRPVFLRKLWGMGARGRVVVIPPERIDQENLTQLELMAMVTLINFFRPVQVMCDTPVSSSAIPGFRRSLSHSTGLGEAQILLFPKADARVPLVAGASLLAKVVRDAHVRALHRTYGDFGWGYPGEPKVREYLARHMHAHGELPPICRKRWRSVQKAFGLKLQ